MTKIQTLRTDRADCIRRARFHAARTFTTSRRDTSWHDFMVLSTHEDLRDAYVILARDLNRRLIAAKRGQQELSL